MRAGMVGMGMIFDETYRPFFETVHQRKLYDPAFGVIDVPLVAVATRTGSRAKKYQDSAAGKVSPFQNFSGTDSLAKLLKEPVDFVCVATPDDRHFEAAKAVLNAGKHLLIEKPSVLDLQQLDELVKLASQNNVLAKVVYHKLLDPDHKKLRTLVHDRVLQHVNNGYCSLLEP
ncbi:MAG: Gfo/Idh/MocA family oxidoreductase, partial [Planctomycetaceae bacterium]|nr:Gfo/Idh/MocA family oxidoreductase [Planctomycetaceae bacterium]